eukprot:6154066-Pyramimonas_sp.AAC.1
MLSRATTVDDLLMIRDPGLDFLARGPPADLVERLREFSSRERTVTPDYDGGHERTTTAHER